MFTDMVGSTAAAQANEAEALQLRDEQAELVRPLFTAHQGREIKSMGDGFLAEFDSALRAVQCAIDIQQHLHERNTRPGSSPIQVRIGIHLGDVEQRESDIFGDAVNIASRIEPEAEPGGVCVSRAVYEQVRNKITDRFEKLPPTALKGLQSSLEIYRIVLPWSLGETSSANSGSTGIAVLPFTNISPDPKDEYFADGLTEELITVLSELQDLRVISRTSVMQYKATTKAVSQIGAELGVSSILEGSVRKAGNRLRITAQLIDVRSDRHLWAKTYERDLDDVFAVQAELARQVADALEIKLRATEQARLESRPSIRPDSYLAYLKGRSYLHTLKEASTRAGKEQFELAISLDPGNAAAHSGLADAIRLMAWGGTGTYQHKEWEKAARRSAARAIELDPFLAEAHASLAIILWDDREYPAAEREFKLALSLNPSYSLAHHWYGVVLLDEGRAEEGLVEFRLAEEVDPLWPLNLLYFSWTLICLGRLDEAFGRIQRLGDVEPDGQPYHSAFARYCLARSDLNGFLRELRREIEGDAEPGGDLGTQALICAYSGENEKAGALLKEYEATELSMANIQSAVWAYCKIGDLDGCFRIYDRALEYGTPPFQMVRIDPEAEPIRRDPRFGSLLKKMKLA